MAEIILNGKITEIDRVIAFGCSYTAGAELLDHLIHPDADNIKRKKGMKYWKDKFDSPETWKISAAEGNYTWAAKVADRLSVDFVNKARGGSSLGYSLFMLEDAILKGEVTDKTLVLVGITTMNRSILFDEVSVKHMLISTPQYWPKNLTWDIQTVLNVFSDSMLIWIQLNYLHRFVELSNRFSHRIQLFKMPESIIDNKVLELIENKQSKELFNYKMTEILSAKSCFHNEESLFSVRKIDKLIDIHGGGHPKVHIHEAFADYVMECLGK